MGMSSGFQIWSPSAPPPETYFGVFGSDFSQILELTVNPGEVVTAEPRTMLFMTPGDRDASPERKNRRQQWKDFMSSLGCAANGGLRDGGFASKSEDI